MGFQISSTFRETVSNDGLVHESLGEGFALEAVREGGGERHAREAVYGDGDRQALMVEILHHWEVLVGFGEGGGGGGG